MPELKKKDIKYKELSLIKFILICPHCDYESEFPGILANKTCGLICLQVKIIISFSLSSAIMIFQFRL